jgi:hypothetical protein
VDKMVFAVLEAVAEMERGLIVERVKAGLRNAKAKGKQLGPPEEDPGPEEDCHAARQGSWLEADRCRDGRWSRNYLTRCPGGFQNSGKGF